MGRDPKHKMATTFCAQDFPCSALPRGEPAKRLACFITLPAGKPLNFGILSEACGAIAANDGPAESGQHHREFEEHAK